MAYIDKVVDVTVELGTQPIDTVGFETPMFLAIHNVFPERVRAYTDLDQLVSDGFAPGSPAHTFATKAFGGKFRPSILLIGRQALTGTTVDFTGQSNDDTVFLNVAVGKYVTSVSFAATDTTTPAQIATGIAAAINGDTLLSPVITATATGSVVSITGTSYFSIGAESGNYKVTNTTGESVSVAISAANAVNENWYFLSTESHSAQSILAAASYASANYKMHVYSTADAGSKDPLSATSIADQLKALSYDTSIGMYDPLADSAFPEGGIVGATASNDPSYGDSVHLKTMAGTIAPSLSPTDRMTIWGKNLNFYRVINGVGSFYEGKVASGQYFDVVRFGHWLKFRSEESVFGYMSRRSNLGLSMKMSDEDLPNLKAVLMNSPINTGITNGAILTGYDTVNKVFYDPVVTIPVRATIPSNDIAARILNNVKVELVYNSPLHFVKIRMSVLLDKTGSSTGTGQTVTAGV